MRFASVRRRECLDLALLSAYGSAMRLIDRYFLRQVLAPFVFFTLVLTGVMWLAQSLRVIDLIVNNGQSASILLTFAGPLLPLVLSIVFPLAALGATIFALNRLMTDSELVVVYSAGEGRLSSLRAVLVFGVGVSVALAIVTVLLAPIGARAMREKTAEVRSDIASALIQDGRFMHPSDGLTVYIREANGPGDMRGVMVHDAREPEAPVTFNAQRGALMKTESGPRLVMFDGLAQRIDPKSDSLSLLQFDKIGYDLSEFVSDPAKRRRKASEFFFYELIWPDNPDLSERDYGRYISEGHEQLSSPLYGFAIVVVAAAAMLKGSFSRRGYVPRMIAAAVLGVSLRVIGLGLQNVVKSAPEAWPIMYLPPIIASVLALWLLSRGKFRAASGQAVPA